jgi:hypothetical protein
MSRSLIRSASNSKKARTSRAITAPPTITGARSGSSGRICLRSSSGTEARRFSCSSKASAVSS